MSKAVISLDIGGTSMKGALVSKTGDILHKEEFDTDPSFTTDEHKSYIIKCVESLITKKPSEYDIVGFGADSPGISDKTGVHIGGAENVPGLKGLSFKDIGRVFNVDALHANDASVAALGEFRYGSGRGKDSKAAMIITVGTGIGGGFVFDGELFTGSIGAAGEIGHVCLVPNGERCNCGSVGCVERYCSATAYISSAKTKVHKGLKQTELTMDIIEKGGAKVIFDYAKKGDRLANDVVAECSHYLGIAISQATNMLDLDLVLIGGGICKDFEMIIPYVRSAVIDYTLKIQAERLSIEKASLGNDAGILGCAAMFFK